jgi:predicted nucleic-acid-binding Zn-ribbon protein
MAQKPAAKHYQIKGHTLECPVCKNNTFWTRKTLMNTKGMTFFKVEWANKEADNYVCDNCGYVSWFIHS